MRPEEILEQDGLALPHGHPVVGNYVACVRTGSLVFVSGHGPFLEGKPAVVGKLGGDLSVEEGKQAAQIVMLNILSTLKREVGELSNISRFVKLLVLVNSEPDFTRHPAVADGATELLVRIFGERGRPARSAVGAPSLPLNIAVEIEAVVEVGP
jgi:enamine deaminase RidA (YjgF/YER057c/UK114 family)